MQRTELFSPLQIGPLTLRNRSIRAAAFEGMCKNHEISQELINYHTSVAEGGIGMSTVAFSAVSQQGLLYPHQLLLNDDAIHGLINLSTSIQSEGALASIQIGHSGKLAKWRITNKRPVSSTSTFKLKDFTWVKEMTLKNILEVLVDFQNAVRVAAEGNFDAVEIHAGHGYLIHQFLSPYTNKRKDAYGGSFKNRSRFLKEVLQAVKEVLPPHMALIVKMNIDDGFAEGIQEDEVVKTAKLIEENGADAIIPTGGTMCKTPLFIMKGNFSLNVLKYYQGIKNALLPSILKDENFKPFEFKEAFFLDKAKLVKKAVNIPVVLLGGLHSKESIDHAFKENFDAVALGRPLIRNPHFINDLKAESCTKSTCTKCNFCLAKVLNSSADCYLNEKENIPNHLVSEIESFAN